VTFVKILCPVDFSEHSQRAVRFAALLARSFGSQITLLHVNDPVLVATSAIVFAERAEDETRAELNRLLDEALADGRHHVRDVTILVAEGDPSEQIATVAEEHGIDLIVMGTHGRGPIMHMVLGSVAERVVRTAPCPVLTVREPRAPIAATALQVFADATAAGGAAL
jgi:universal stress protein A